MKAVCRFEVDSMSQETRNRRESRRELGIRKKAHLSDAYLDLLAWHKRNRVPGLRSAFWNPRSSRLKNKVPCITGPNPICDYNSDGRLPSIVSAVCGYTSSKFRSISPVSSIGLSENLS